MSTTVIPETNWTTVGEELVGRVGGRDQIWAGIAELEWQEVPVGGKLKLGFMPGMAINKIIEEFSLSKVSHVAVSSFECPAPDEEGDGFYPGFYGIECHYKNGRAKIYVIDTGTVLVPVRSDFWPAAS